MPQILISQHPAISNPPPTQIPSIRATVGIGQLNISPKVPCKNLPYDFANFDDDLSFLNSPISLPGEKDFLPLSSYNYAS